MGKDTGSITVGGVRIKRGTSIGYRPSKGVDTNTSAIVREVRSDLDAVRVDTYRNGKLLSSDSGWYRIGNGLYRELRGTGAYIVGNGRRGLNEPPAKKRK